MPRKPSSQPNDVELAILRVLWDCGPSTVREIHDALRGSRDAGYTSTLKMMQVMVEKGVLKRDSSRRPHIYRPAVPEEQTQRSIMSNMLKSVFGGSTRKLVLRAVETGRINDEERAEIRKLLDRMEGGAR
jgi:BlaI family penicillinase repressor